MQLTRHEIAKICLERWQDWPDAAIDKMPWPDVTKEQHQAIASIRDLVGCWTPDFGKWLSNHLQILQEFCTAGG